MNALQRYVLFPALAACAGTGFSQQPDAPASREFQLKAPSAREVTLRGQWPGGNQAFVRNDDGVWKLAVNEIPPGVWEYSFVVDGLQIVDPGNPAIKPMRQPRTSILHIPSSPPAPWDWQDVPHGTIHYHSYTTTSGGHLRELAVYTPPGYESSATTTYPFLVLQHGSGDNQRTWTDHGKAHWIYDNLIAAGKAIPAVVLMTNGHPAGIDRRDRGALAGAFLSELIADAIPLVESRYRVRGEPGMRAMAGLSMGGGQTLRQYLQQKSGLSIPGSRFGYFGAFSASAPSKEDVDGAFADAGGTRYQKAFLWIACGRDDFLLERNLAFREKLNQRNLPHEWHLTDGDHSWPVWRKYLADFIPHLFRGNEAAASK